MHIYACQKSIVAYNMWQNLQYIPLHVVHQSFCKAAKVANSNAGQPSQPAQPSPAKPAKQANILGER